MQKLSLLAAFLLSALTVEARDIPLPDAVGKYLFYLAVNRSDISKSLMQTDAGDYVDLYKKTWLPYLLKDIDEASETEKIYRQVEIDEMDLRAEALYTENYIDKWAVLLQNCGELGITPENTIYYKTFFRLVNDQDIELPLNGMDLYVAMNYAGNIYTFHVAAQWTDNRWIIMETDPELYLLYTQDDCSELVFHPETMTNGIPAMMEETTFIPPADTFSRNILEFLKENAPFGSGNIFLTENEYMETCGKAIIKQLEKRKEKGELNESELAEVNPYLDNPSLLYTTQLKGAWSRLQESLKEEFDGNTSNLFPYGTKYEVYNRNEEFIGINNITVRTSMAFDQGGHKAGIVFEAIRHDNAWKLSYVQAFPYGISGTAAAEEDAGTEEEEEMNEIEATDQVEDAFLNRYDEEL